MILAVESSVNDTAYWTGRDRVNFLGETRHKNTTFKSELKIREDPFFMIDKDCWWRTIIIIKYINNSISHVFFIVHRHLLISSPIQQQPAR